MRFSLNKGQFRVVNQPRAHVSGHQSWEDMQTQNLSPLRRLLPASHISDISHIPPFEGAEEVNVCGVARPRPHRRSTFLIKVFKRRLWESDVGKEPYETSREDSDGVSESYSLQIRPPSCSSCPLPQAIFYS